LCNNAALKEVILEDLKRVSREAKLPGFEIVANIYLEPKPWTTDDLLTYT